MKAFEWQRACRDCRSTWDVQYEDDGHTVANETDCVCPECGSTAVELLSVAQHRAELAEDAASARADYERDASKDGWR